MKKIRFLSVIIGVVALILGFGPYVCKYACDLGVNGVNDTAKVIITNLFLVVNFLALFCVKNKRGNWLKFVSVILSLVVVSFTAYTADWMASIIASSSMKIVALALLVLATVLGVISYVADNKTKKTEA